MKSTRIPYAPSTPLPELAEFLAPFRIHFKRSEGPQALERYLTGLLTEYPNKNCDTLAHVVPGTTEQRLQGLLTAMAWDEEDLNRQRVERLLTLPTEGDGVLIFDDTGFAKQGQCSVGVARRYSGTLGKTGNCQVSVNCHYAERTIAWQYVSNGEGYGRVDLRIGESGQPYVLEVNPCPDLSSDAGLARMGRAFGWTYDDLVMQIVDEALTRKDSVQAATALVSGVSAA